jgi:hypothetical protein
MAILDKITLSSTTYDIVDSTALHTLDDNVTSGGTNAVKGSGIYNAITAATGALAETIAEQGYQTSGDVQNAISGKADAASAVTDFRVTSDNGKKQLRYGIARNGTFGTDAVLAQFNSGFTMYDKTVSIDTTVIAQKTDIPAVSGYADSVKYNSTSKEVEFYHGGTGGTKVFEYDASPFLIDGMVQNVEIKDVTISGESVTCLVISFNTAAGKQDINIPISEIFDASNYYTKAETDDEIDAKIAAASGVTTGQVQTMIDQSISGKADTTAVTAAIDAATSGKADTTAVTQVNNALTAHTSNADIHVTASDKTTWSGKQDALVSGTNIKTINGSSILGSGDMTVDTGLHAEVQGTTLIFS